MRILRELDYLLLAATLVMVLLGVTMIYSAAFHSDSTTVQTAWDRQAKFAFLALAVALAIVYIPDKVLYSIAHPLYFIGLLSLLAVLAWGICSIIIVT